MASCNNSKSVTTMSLHGTRTKTPRRSLSGSLAPSKTMAPSPTGTTLCVARLPSSPSTPPAYNDTGPQHYLQYRRQHTHLTDHPGPRRLKGIVPLDRVGVRSPRPNYDIHGTLSGQVLGVCSELRKHLVQDRPVRL